MAIDVLPIYEILVDDIFGSVGLAIIGILGILILIMFITRVSRVFIWYWISFYLIVMGTLYLGAIGMVMGFLFSLAYFFTAFIRTFFREG